MPPPPVTPSPHRFLAKAQNKPASTTTSKSNEAGKLQHKLLTTPDVQHERHAPKFNTSAARTPAAKPRVPKFDTPIAGPVSRAKHPQFVAAPRFGYARPSSPKRPRLEQPDDGREQFATPRRFVNPEPEVLIEDDHNSAFPFDDSHIHDDEARALATKPTFLSRQRTPVDAPISQIQSVAEPPSPLLPLRPVFLQPPSAAQAPVHPLPEAFSPHRRGQKFLPGGMADEVRQWALDTSRHVPDWRGHANEGWRVRVAEVRKGSGGLCQMRCSVETDASREVKVCLPGAGIIGSKNKVRPGNLLQLRGAMWDIDLGEEGVWTVATEWKVLKENG